ncbi:MAG: hypothetical protein WD578_12795 [Bacteroidales bacterium]
MRPRILYVILLIFPLVFHACTDELTDLQKDSFMKFYGSYLNDAGRDVKALPSGGYAITGNIVPDSIVKMALIITDEAGNQVEGSPWFYGGKYQTGGTTLLLLEDGYLLGGTLVDTASDGELYTDMFLVKTDAAGNEVWSQRYGNEESDLLNHVIHRKTGGFVLAGKKTTNENEDLWIVMVDENGNKLYDFTGKDVDDDDEANFLISTGNGYLCACTYDDGSMEGTDIYILSLNENCSPEGSTVLGTEDDDIARTIIRYQDGFAVMGYTENTLTGQNDISVYTFSVENHNFKNVQKMATLSEPLADLTGEDCVVNSKGDIAIIGSREANDNRDMYLVIIDSSGSIVGEPALFGGSGNQTGQAIDKTADGGLILTGSNAFGGNTVITLVKTDAGGAL